MGIGGIVSDKDKRSKPKKISPYGKYLAKTQTGGWSLMLGDMPEAFQKKYKSWNPKQRKAFMQRITAGK